LHRAALAEGGTTPLSETSALATAKIRPPTRWTVGWGANMVASTATGMTRMREGSTRILLAISLRDCSLTVITRGIRRATRSCM
jgi:hypothetical protein